MKIQLINGYFSAKDAIDILTKLAQVKVNYHERQIKHSDNEEDIKTREKRIKDLQRDLAETRQYIENSGTAGVSLQADIMLTVNAVQS